MTETLVRGYSSESAQRELTNEYHHDRVKMVFKNRYVLVLLAKVASALEELNMKEKMKTCFLSESIHLYLILLRIDQIETIDISQSNNNEIYIYIYIFGGGGGVPTFELNQCIVFGSKRMIKIG